MELNMNACSKVYWAKVTHSHLKGTWHSTFNGISNLSIIKDQFSIPKQPRKNWRVSNINTLNPNLKCCRWIGRHKENDHPFKSKEHYIRRKEGDIAKVCRSKSFRNNWEHNLDEKEEKGNLDEDSTDEILNFYTLWSEASKSWIKSWYYISMIKLI